MPDFYDYRDDYFKLRSDEIVMRINNYLASESSTDDSIQTYILTFHMKGLSFWDKFINWLNSPSPI
jgi:hypothetical protein